MPVFGYGDMRLYLLKLLDEEPRYGYELIRLLEDRFLGTYTPSAGTIYPRLAALEEEGLVEHFEEDGRKVYRLTDAGREELRARGQEMVDLEQRVGQWAGDLARGVIDEMKSTLESLGRDFRGTVSDVSRHAQAEVLRDVIRSATGAADRSRSSRRGQGRRVNLEWGGDTEERRLRVDLNAFVADVTEAARANPPDKERMRRIQQLLLDARHAIDDVLDEGRSSTSGPAQETAE